MINKIMAVLAFAVLVGFLSILLIHVPRLDLAVVIGFTILLAAWDLYSTHRSRKL
jgi:hypothetical protein